MSAKILYVIYIIKIYNEKYYNDYTLNKRKYQTFYDQANIF